VINRLRSYRNGVHGPFFLSVADELERLQTENQQLRTEAIEMAECVSGLRSAIRQMNLRTIINTRHVQIWGEIKTAIERVRNLEQLPVSAINYIDTLVNVVEEEATKHVTG